MLLGPDALAGFGFCKSFSTLEEVKWICGMNGNCGTDGLDTKLVSLTNTYLNCLFSAFAFILGSVMSLPSTFKDDTP